MRHMSVTNIIVIGSSTGGPKILKRVLSNLPLLNACIVLVQHMPKFINATLRESLDRETDMNVTLAKEGEILEHGKLYIAPSELHLELIENKEIHLFDGEKVNFVRPSVDVAMKSLQKKTGQHVIGVVLTGMGKDGASGIRHIKQIGGFTIAEDEGSSIVYGMPKAAFETGDVDLVLNPENIKNKLIELVGKQINIEIP